MAGLVVSCGVLVMTAQRELLMGHATGTPRWDIPKGIGEPGEDARSSALRETLEETGLVLRADDLLDLGRFGYLRTKDLHLHAVLVERFDAARCVCSTHYLDARGRRQPEMDRHAWFDFESALGRCGKSMAALFSSRVSLDAVLGELLARERRLGPAQWQWSAG